MRAQPVNASTLNAATRVLLGMASTSAPAGTWLAMAATVPTLNATPTAVCVQRCETRYTAMKGPKPVWMLATNKLNQSSARPATRTRRRGRRSVRHRRYLRGLGPRNAEFLGGLQSAHRFTVCWRTAVNHWVP